MSVRKRALKKLGDRIRQIRQSQNVTQQELAARLDVEQAYISNIERGIRSPSFTRLVLIADALTTTVSELCEDI